MQFSTIYPIEVSTSNGNIEIEGDRWCGSLADLSGLLTGLPSVDGVFAESAAEFEISPRKRLKVIFDQVLPSVSAPQYLQVLRDRVEKVWHTYEHSEPAAC